jgi:hypothetical protein
LHAASAKIARQSDLMSASIVAFRLYRMPTIEARLTVEPICSFHVSTP